MERSGLAANANAVNRNMGRQFMKNTRCFLAGVLAIASAAFVQAQLVIDISCQGMESGGGSLVLQYQYELHNPGAAPIVITSFSVGTDDLNPANYTAWTVPVGVGYNWVWAVQGGGVWSDGVKTPHGQIAPLPPYHVTAGVVFFTETIGAGMTLAPGATATFGFNDPNHSEDVEWITTVGASNWALPVAGPTGVFSGGPVHAPVPEPSSYALAFGLGALGFAVWRRFGRKA